MTTLIVTDVLDAGLETSFANPDFAADGSVGTAAIRSSGAGGGFQHAAIVFDFGSAVEVGSFAIAGNISGGDILSTTDWPVSVEVGDSPLPAGPWTELTGTINSVPSFETWARTSGAVSARYLRLRWEDQNGGLAFWPWIEITEITFDGATTPPPSPPDPLPAIHVEIDGVEFTGLREQTIRVALNDAGSFFFAINRADDQATEENIYRGAIVQVTIPQIHDDVLWEGIIESGDFDICR